MRNTITITEYQREPAQIQATSLADILTYIRNTRVALPIDIARAQKAFEKKYFNSLPTEETTAETESPIRENVLLFLTGGAVIAPVAGAAHLAYRFTGSTDAVFGAVMGTMLLMMVGFILFLRSKKPKKPATLIQSLPEIHHWPAAAVIHQFFIPASDGATCTEIQERSDGYWEVFFTGFEPGSDLRHRLTVCDSQDEAISFVQTFYDDFLPYVQTWNEVEFDPQKYFAYLSPALPQNKVEHGKRKRIAFRL
jgi:hypothetical protein